VNKEQHYSVDVPEDWVTSSPRGVAQFASPKLPRHTIIIRVADRPKSLGESKPATDDALVDVTEHVLASLPKATMEKRSVLTAAELPGVLFDLTFAPHGAPVRYHRAHAFLLGEEHLYHVIYSAPAGEPIQTDAYNLIVHSLTEGA
jgi:hypothetical protein